MAKCEVWYCEESAVKQVIMPDAPHDEQYAAWMCALCARRHHSVGWVTFKSYALHPSKR